jgi:hypothetical protein
MHQPSVPSTQPRRRDRKKASRLTFLLTPFLSSFPPFPFTSFPLPEPAPPTAGLASLGLAVKNPSNLPCCFALMCLASLSAPLRTRSSLQAGGTCQNNKRKAEQGREGTAKRGREKGTGVEEDTRRTEENETAEKKKRIGKERT